MLLWLSSIGCFVVVDDDDVKGFNGDDGNEIFSMNSEKITYDKWIIDRCHDR